jgi:hypothetical protein
MESTTQTNIVLEIDSIDSIVVYALIEKNAININPLSAVEREELYSSSLKSSRYGLYFQI